jgi:FixJ family two-component response regulator
MVSTARLTEHRERDRSLIAVVDDDESLRRSLGNFRRSVGFRVETFASAEAFLRSAERAHSGGLVLDLRMNGMTGLDLLGHLRAAGDGISIVVLTAGGDDETRQRCLEAGAVAFLMKPFQRDALLHAVRTALGRHASDNDGQTRQGS